MPDQLIDEPSKFAAYAYPKVSMPPFRTVEPALAIAFTFATAERSILTAPASAGVAEDRATLWAADSKTSGELPPQALRTNEVNAIAIKPVLFMAVLFRSSTVSTFNTRIPQEDSGSRLSVAADFAYRGQRKPHQLELRARFALEIF
jgi:hypothetical protein